MRVSAKDHKGRLRTVLQTNVEMNLADYLGVAKRQKAVLLLVTALVMVAVGVLTAFQTRYYTATTDILVELEPSTDLITSQSSGRTDSDRQLENEVGFLESRIVVDVVREQLGFEPTVTISSSPSRDFLTIRATETTPQAAHRAASVYAEAYLTTRRELAISEFATTAGIVQQQITELDNMLLEIDRSPTSQSERDERRLPIVAQRSVYAQGLANIQLNADLTSGAVGRIVSPAELPTEPSSPRSGLNLGLALLVGLVASLVAALIRDNLADLVVGRDGAQQLIGNHPILADVPRYRTSDSSSALETDLNSVEAESYRTLRTSLAFAMLNNDQRVVQVTSSTMGEGKSEVVANLAVALARGGKRVLAIDADLRRPTLASRFGIDPEHPGLSSAIAREVRLRDALIECEELPTLSIMPSGPMPADPAAFLESPLLGKALEKLAEHFDYVLVDTPPVGMVSDPLTISTLVDGLIVVARHNRTNRTELLQTVESLDRLEAPILGLVLNGVDSDRSYSRGYYTRIGRVADHRINITDKPTSKPAQKDEARPIFVTTTTSETTQGNNGEIDLAHKPSMNTGP